jgi:hypothetical protein
MNIQEIIRRRLANQLLIRPSLDHPAAVVAWFGAVQAQDYLGALWAVGQRTPGAVESDVELALAERSIVRTWPMRGTLHFVAADDVRWMLELLTPRIVQRHALRLQREFELDTLCLSRCRKVLERALQGGALTRRQVYDALESGGLSVAGQRGIHILGRLAQEGLICFGPRAGKQQTFVLLDEWLPESRGLLRDEALAELALRYFTSHGPAAVRDFAWWSGLTLTDARAGLHLVERRLLRESFNGADYWCSPAEVKAPRKTRTTAHLLPPFDEYLVGYQDRSAVLDPRYVGRLQALLSPVVELDGKIVGTWGRRLIKGKAALHFTPFSRWGRGGQGAAAAAAQRYGEFLGLPVTLC